MFASAEMRTGVRVRRWLRVGCLLAPMLAAGARGADFVLLDETAGRAYGPYKYVNTTPVLNGAWTLDLSQGNAVRLREGTGSKTRVEGPFAFTNGATFTLLGRSYRLLLETKELLKGIEMGRQTAVLRDALTQALALKEPRDGIELLRQAAATNALARNTHELEQTRAKLNEQIRLDDLKIAGGLEKFEGDWYPKDEAARLRKQRQEADYRAQGLELYEGEWLTPGVIAERKRVLIEEQKQAAVLKRKQDAARRCKRCQGTGKIFIEIHPPVQGAGTAANARPTPPLRIERPGVPKDSPYQTEVESCPDCEGKGLRD